MCGKKRIGFSYVKVMRLGVITHSFERLALNVVFLKMLGWIKLIFVIYAF